MISRAASNRKNASNMPATAGKPAIAVMRATVGRQPHYGNASNSMEGNSCNAKNTMGKPATAVTRATVETPTPPVLGVLVVLVILSQVIPF
jgi:hypothetical protein